MSNGVEVIVAGPTPALRWENSNPQPTLTLSDAVVMLLPQDKPNEFVTKTCTTTFTYLSTITKDGTTTVSTEQQVFTQTHVYTYTFPSETSTVTMYHALLKFINNSNLQSKASRNYSTRYLITGRQTRKLLSRD